jgi:hypothetical protein
MWHSCFKLVLAIDILKTSVDWIKEHNPTNILLMLSLLFSIQSILLLKRICLQIVNCEFHLALLSSLQ